jgi:ATP-dependent DNA helicase DinG
VGYLLEEWLWSRCLGAVLVSATLTALSSFSYFRHQVGLKSTTAPAICGCAPL